MSVLEGVQGQLALYTYVCMYANVGILVCDKIDCNM